MSPTAKKSKAAARAKKTKATKKVTKKKAAAKKAPSKKSSAKKTTGSKKASAKKAAAKKKPAARKASATKTPKKATKKTVAKKAPARKAAAKKGTRRAKRGATKLGLSLPKFRRLLEAKHRELVHSYSVAKGNTRSTESDGTEDYIDYAVSSYDRDFMLSLTEMERRQLVLVEEALKRIERREFGRCLNCGTPIPERRLEVEPWARYCIPCQELDEQGLLDLQAGDSPFEDEDEEADDEDDVGAAAAADDDDDDEEEVEDSSDDDDDDDDDDDFDR